jgi:hypothetical protein
VHPLPAPLPPLARSLSLSARAGQLGALPADIAARTRALIGEAVLGPALADWPWLAGGLRPLGPQAG